MREHRRGRGGDARDHNTLGMTGKFTAMGSVPRVRTRDELHLGAE